MPVKIHLIAPIINDTFNRADIDALGKKRRDLEITTSDIPYGPVSVESDLDDALAVPHMVAEAIKAEKAGVHAIVLDCMADPGLQAIRECVRIPVLGPRMTCAHIASTLSHKFSFICVKSRSRPRFESHLAEYGLLDHVASIRAVDLNVDDVLKKGPDELHKRIVEESVAAVMEDGAHAIIVGCTAFYGCEKIVGKALAEKGLHGIPVLNPIVATVACAAGLVDAGLTHSLLTYPTPPEKKRTGYNIPGFSKL